VTPNAPKKVKLLGIDQRFEKVFSFFKLSFFSQVEKPNAYILA